MSGDSVLLQCYNRGCGQKYDPTINSEDSCQHHPGVPVFHDAYKGWSCCNKKCTDFTEFLNIKGCTLSKHSNEKPIEPEKPPANNVSDTEVIEVKPIVPSTLKRPPFDTPMVLMTPVLAPSVKQNIGTVSNQADPKSNEQKDSTVIQIGTNCKNGGCSATYQGSQSESSTCIHHPGVPIFHEGLKFWSCCQKRTSDFTAFLNQVGCTNGTHLWIKEDANKQDVDCRWDHHQTGGFVVVSIYAKQYCPTASTVQLNPIRLCAKLVFPQEGNYTFNLDIELKGIVDVESSQVTMFGTKVEIKLKKAEPGSWTRIDIPRKVEQSKESEKKDVETLIPEVDAVDLSDL